MSIARRRELIEPQHPTLPVSRQCALVGISRSAFYAPAKGENLLNLALMRLIDAQFLETPWYGSRQMTRHLRRQGRVVGTQAGTVEVATDSAHDSLRSEARAPCTQQR